MSGESAQSPTPTLARELSKLLSAMDQQWKEELGGPDATETEAVIRKTHWLLTRVSTQKFNRSDIGSTLTDYIGNEWIANNPWVIKYLAKIETQLDSLCNP